MDSTYGARNVVFGELTSWRMDVENVNVAMRNLRPNDLGTVVIAPLLGPNQSLELATALADSQMMLPSRYGALSW